MKERIKNLLGKAKACVSKKVSLYVLAMLIIAILLAVNYSKMEKAAPAPAPEAPKAEAAKK